MSGQEAGGGGREEGRGGSLTLVVGGARSGKSTLIERLARESGRKVVFIATAKKSDNDMRDRIAKHQEDRPSHWQTIEEHVNLVEAVRAASEQRGGEVILIDCMTLWLANWLEHSGLMEVCSGDSGQAMEEVKPSSSGKKALDDITALLTVIQELPSDRQVLIVSNEVGLGICPHYQISRIYRDTLGWVNQTLAKHAKKVYFMVAGLAIDLKKTDREAALYA